MILWANYNGIPNFKRSACSVFCGSCLFNSSVFLAARIELCFVNDDVVPWFPCHKGFHDTNIAIFLLVVVVGRFFHTFQEPRKKQKNTKKKTTNLKFFHSSDILLLDDTLLCLGSRHTVQKWPSWSDFKTGSRQNYASHFTSTIHGVCTEDENPNMIQFNFI